MAANTRSKRIVKKIISSVLSGSEWDMNYLQSLGLDIENVNSIDELFDIDTSTLNIYNNKKISSLLSLDIYEKASEKILSQLENEELDDTVMTLLKNLYSVAYAYPGQESFVDDLGKSLFLLTNISRLKNIVVGGPIEMSMVMAGHKFDAKPDICVTDISENKIVLVVQEDKSYSTSSLTISPDAQLVAEMVASYYNNFNTNNKLEKQRIYGITIMGTYCSFFRFDIDKKILNSLREGYKHNADDTKIGIIYKYHVGKSKIPGYMLENKKNMENTLLCYEALRISLINRL